MPKFDSQNGVAKRVFIVEDHPVFREGLVHMLKGEKGLEVCGSAGDARNARETIARAKPDLVLIDISLPGKSGLELIKEIRSVDREVKLLVVSMHDEALYANRVLRLGGDGYIMKQEDPGEILHAIRDVLNGHIYVSEEVLTAQAPGAEAAKPPSRPAKPAARRLEQLTDSELETLEFLGRGNSEEEIAEVRDSTVKDIAAECAAMKKKLGLKTDNALIRYAVCWVETGRA